MRQGLDPQTGEFLRQRHGADRFASNGEEQSKARSLYDMTFSAPKSVSASLSGHGNLGNNSDLPAMSVDQAAERKPIGCRMRPALDLRTGIRLNLNWLMEFASFIRYDP